MKSSPSTHTNFNGVDKVTTMLYATLIASDLRKYYFSRNDFFIDRNVKKMDSQRGFFKRLNHNMHYNRKSTYNEQVRMFRAIGNGIENSNLSAIEKARLTYTLLKNFQFQLAELGGTGLRTIIDNELKNFPKDTYAVAFNPRALNLFISNADLAGVNSKLLFPKAYEKYDFAFRCLNIEKEPTFVVNDKIEAVELTAAVAPNTRSFDFSRPLPKPQMITKSAVPVRPLPAVPAIETEIDTDTASSADIELSSSQNTISATSVTNEASENQAANEFAAQLHLGIYNLKKSPKYEARKAPTQDTCALIMGTATLVDRARALNVSSLVDSFRSSFDDSPSHGSSDYDDSYANETNDAFEPLRNSLKYSEKSNATGCSFMQEASLGQHMFANLVYRRQKLGYKD